MFFTNKHVVIALIVAPILSILAWFAVGEYVGEKPHAAQQGSSYPLLEMSNCRYDSGSCGLENKDFKLEMVLSQSPAGSVLELSSVHELDGIMVSVSEPGADTQPQAMQAVGNDGRHWRLAIGRAPGPEQRIRLVASKAGTSWFGETSTTFTTGTPGAGGASR